jgi:NAD(P)-dependent dehydrogenase (short-subunit alcohol dehydrogenase family)
MTRTALVTGCSTGIGRATALALVRAGFTTWATAREPATLTELAAAGCRTQALDVTDEASMQAAVDAAGHVDVLVNNAGYAEYGPVELVPLEQWRKQFETNVFGLVRMTQIVLPHMREQRWGRVVNMSSMGGELTFPLGAAYHATKYAVEAISDALRSEVAPFGIRVVLIQPGPVKSQFEATADETLRRYESTAYGAVVRGFSRLMADTYGSRLAGTPQQVARAVVKAAQADAPRARIKVTPHAHVLVRARKVLPDRVWDAALASRLPDAG